VAGAPLPSSLLLSSLDLSDTQVYEPYIRALLGTDSHFCEVVVLKLRTAPVLTHLNHLPRHADEVKEHGETGAGLHFHFHLDKSREWNVSNQKWNLF